MYARSYVLAKIILTLSTCFPDDVADQWLEDLEVIESTESKIILYSPSQDDLRKLRAQYYPYICELAKKLLQCNAIVEIWGSTELEQYKQSQKTKPSYLKPQFRFSNFVVGTSNEMAAKTAKAVASNPGNEAYNPLYIYGPSGVGKTHLLCAIANEIYINKPEVSICYVLADTFISELIWGLRSGRYEEFRSKYRSVDVLIVEDIQFLAGKASTQEEFYYIVDYLHQNNKQLIFSSNSYPTAIPGLESHLSSKFEQGVVVGIEGPDFSIRQNVITQLANKYELGISKESILYIAGAIPDSIRKVVGIMKMLRAAQDLDNLSLTEDNIKTILARSMQHN